MIKKKKKCTVNKLQGRKGVIFPKNRSSNLSFLFSKRYAETEKLQKTNNFDVANFIISLVIEHK